jgi:uncharacterized metal-binding protein
MQNKVVILPCSGIGKSFGTVARYATHIVVNELRSEKTETICLPLLQIDDKEALDLVKNNFVISIDGCGKKCSYVDVERSRGRPSELSIMVAHALRENRELVTKEVTFLDENGKKLAMKVAEMVAIEVDKLIGKKSLRKYDNVEFP